MTPEEAREKYGINVGDYYHKKGYVYCKGCPADRNICNSSGSGYDDCWETIARSIEWANEGQNTVGEMPSFSQRQQEESYFIENMVTLFGIQAVKDYCRCNIYRYTFLSNRKNSPECMQKAEWFMDRLREFDKE